MQTIKYEWLNVEFDLYECQLPNTHCSKICNNCGKYIAIIVENILKKL